MNYVFDTNILVLQIKAHPALTELELEINADPRNIRILSIVSKGEIESLAMQNNWGAKRLASLEKLVQQFLIVPLDSNQIVRAYAEIDSYSQGKHPECPLGTSSRNMGKNDLWIAATTIVTESVLVTTDNDFDHLDPTFFRIRKVVL